jgi:hypothetical protein
MTGESNMLHWTSVRPCKVKRWQKECEYKELMSRSGDESQFSGFPFRFWTYLLYILYTVQMLWLSVTVSDVSSQRSKDEFANQARCEAGYRGQSKNKLEITSDHVSPTPARTLNQNAAPKLETVQCAVVCKSPSIIIPCNNMRLPSSF